MDRKSLGSSVGALALIAVLFHMFGGTDSEQRAGQKEPKAMPDLSAFAAHSDATELPPAVQGPWRATQQYFHSDPTAPKDLSECLQHPKTSCPPSLLNGLYAFPPAFNKSNVKAIIATVPDPLHTRMSIETDRYLDAIQQAAFDSGYELATQWLPWTVKAAAEKTGAESRNAAANLDWERLPGLLLFRHHFFGQSRPKEIGAPGPDSLLLVFVAGETPTAGVNGYQFDMARLTIQALLPSSSRTLYVAGPNFSGSFPSMTHLIEGTASSWSHIEMHSGVVTNDGYAAQMLNELKGKPIYFYGFVPPNSFFHEQFKQLIQKLHLDDSQAAEIVETETGFAAASGDNDGSGDNEKKRIPIIRYPRDIAQLRNAYNDAAFASSGGQTGTASPPPVDLSLKDTQAGEDEFPTFSTSHTPISQNAVLEQIARRVKQNHIQLVSLSASNVFDTLFLANFLARNCPDTRVVLPSADLLLVEDAAAGRLSGLMAFSPFPLFPEGTPLKTSGPGSDIITFASSDQAAEFNAVLSLLSTMNEGIAERAAEYRQGYGPALAINGPPSAWVLVLSSRGWMPVDLFSQPGKGSHRIPWWDSSAQPQSSVQDTLSGLKAGGPLWLALCAAIGLLTGVFCYQLWHLKRHPEKRVWNCFCLEDPELKQAQCGVQPTVDRKKVLRSRYFCMNACFSNLAVANALLLCPMLTDNHLGGCNYWAILVLLVAAFMCSATTSVLLVRILVPEHARSPESLALNLGLQLVAASTIIVWGYCCFPHNAASSMFNFRTLMLAASVCPLWPLLLGTLGLFGMAYFQLCRFTWCDRRQPYLDTSLFDGLLENEFTKTRQRLERSLMSSTGGRVWHAIWQRCGAKYEQLAMLCWPFVLLLIVIFLLGHSLYSFESQAFTFTVEGLFAVLAVYTVSNLLRFLNSWRLLRAFLVNLNSIVLGRFLKKVSEFSSGSGPVWIRDVKLMSLSTAVNGYIALHNLDRLPKTSPKQRAAKYREALKTLLKTPDPPSNQDRKKFAEAYRAFRECADEISVELGKNILKKYWENNPLDFIEDEEPHEPADAPAKLKPASTVAEVQRVDVEQAVLSHSWTGQSWTSDRRVMGAAASSSRPQTASANRGDTVLSPFGAFGCLDLIEASNPNAHRQTSGASPSVPSKDEYELASRYVALHYSTYIGYVLHQLQNLLIGSTACFVLLMLALNSFAFQAPQTLFHLASAGLVVGGIVVLVVLAQMERDPILSRLSGSKEGELGKDFYIRALTFGAVPMLTVLGTEFPSIAQYISAWIQPMSAAMH